MKVTVEGSGKTKAVENGQPLVEAKGNLPCNVPAEDLAGGLPSKPEILLNQSASQPLPSPRSCVTSKPVGDTPAPAMDYKGNKGSLLPAKRPRLVFGFAASGGCNKCSQLRESQNREMANLKRARAEERRNLKKEIGELKGRCLRMEETIKFTQAVCCNFKEDCEGLKQKNLKLMVKLNDMKQILMR